MKRNRKNSTSLWLGLVVLFCTSAVSHASSILVDDRVSYSVKIEQEDTRLLQVTTSFALKDNILYMSPYGARQFTDRWAKFVRDLKVTDTNGRKLSVEKLDDAKWRVSAASGTRVRIAYRIALDHENHDWSAGIDSAAFHKKWGVFYTGRSFLIMNGQNRKDIILDFDLPSGWKISGSWAEQGPRKFAASNLEDLAESMFFAGVHNEFSIKRNGFELLFALGGNKIVAQRKDFKKLAMGVMDYYINLMGGIPKPPPGNEFKKALVIINSGSQMDGEVIGNHINMIFNPDGNAQTQLISKFIFAHEFFHLWNGKSIRVSNTTEDWFKEGVTSYYTLKALHHVGVVDDDGYFAILNNLFYQRYSNDKGYGKLSMRDVADGFSKGDHWGLIYGGGLFVGLCQDIVIRSETKNKNSLDQLMVEYYKDYAGTDETYSTADMHASMTKFSGSDQSEFFKKYVYGVEPVPITECLSRAGLNAEIIEGQLKVLRKEGASEIEQTILEGILGE